jgi:hypothetical protein
MDRELSTLYITNVYEMLVENHEGEKSLERHGRRWKDNTKMNRKDVRCDDMNWIELTQSRDQ